REQLSPLFEIARVLVCFDHVASIIVNADHGVPIRLAKVARFFQNSAQYENENFTPNKFTEPLAFALRFAFHSSRARLCSACDASTNLSTRLLRELQHRLR